MSRQMFVLPLALALLAAGYTRSAAQQAAPAGGGNPFDGQWTLTFSAHSPPGGIVMSTGSSTISPGHLQFRGDKRFAVGRDGKFAFQGADAGTFHIDLTTHSASEVSAWRQDQQPLCKFKGTATATPNPPGAREPYARQLELSIEWTGGNGTYFTRTSLGTFAGAFSVSADGTQVTSTRPWAPPYTQRLTYWSSQWKLTPTRVMVEETGPDELQERVTYEGSRETPLEPLSGQAKGTERIEVKQVRQLKLVPRG